MPDARKAVGSADPDGPDTSAFSTWVAENGDTRIRLDEGGVWSGVIHTNEEAAGRVVSLTVEGGTVVMDGALKLSRPN